jgi:hypothetical protein
MMRTGVTCALWLLALLLPACATEPATEAFDSLDARETELEVAIDSLEGGWRLRDTLPSVPGDSGAGLSEEERHAIRMRCQAGGMDRRTNPREGPWVIHAWATGTEIVLEVSARWDSTNTLDWEYSVMLPHGTEALTTTSVQQVRGGGPVFVHLNTPMSSERYPLSGLWDVRNITVVAQSAATSKRHQIEAALCHQDVFSANSDKVFLAAHLIMRRAGGSTRGPPHKGMLRQAQEAATCQFLEWLHYHRRLGVEHVFVYTHHDDTFHQVSAVQQLVEEGVVSLVPHNIDPTDGKNAKPLYFGEAQTLAHFDVVQRFQHRFDWLMMCDFDEFFTPRDTTPAGNELNLTAMLRIAAAEDSITACALQFQTRFIAPKAVEAGTVGRRPPVRGFSSGCLPLLRATNTHACVSNVQNGREKMIVRSKRFLNMAEDRVLETAVHRIDFPSNCMVKVDPGIFEVLHYRELGGAGSGPACTACDVAANDGSCPWLPARACSVSRYAAFFDMPPPRSGNSSAFGWCKTYGGGGAENDPPGQVSKVHPSLVMPPAQMNRGNVANSFITTFAGPSVGANKYATVDETAQMAASVRDTMASSMADGKNAGLAWPFVRGDSWR